jgi:2'-5' RNA ligase
VTRQTVIAYWLIPAEPARSFFQQIIKDLARRHNAPVFEPHVTVHVRADQADAAAKALTKAAHKCPLVRLAPRGVDHSDEFVKTLFVQFDMTSELQQMNQVIRQTANDSSQYELNPHLSLLYKDLAAALRKELTASISVPFSEIPFDSVQVVRCISPTRSCADVQSWQMIESRMLR